MVEYALLARGEDHRLAAEAKAIRELLVEEWGLESQDAEASKDSQSAPSGQADNGGAEVAAGSEATEAAEASAVPKAPAADVIQSTAGSTESKKDQ